MDVDNTWGDDEIPPKPVGPPLEPGVFGRLFPLNEISVVTLPPELTKGIRVLPLVLCVMAAGGFTLSMFGAGCTNPPTVLMTPEQIAGEDAFAIRQICEEEADNNPAVVANTLDRVSVLYPSSSPDLATEAGRDALRHLLPPESILIIYNVITWAPEHADRDIASDLMAWFLKITKEGITVIAFETTERANGGLAALVDPRNLMMVQNDAAAPHEFSGGGCCLERQRRGIYDESPLRWNFWYRVVQGKLKWGMENRPADDNLSKKKREMLQRRSEAVKHLKAGMSQRELAEHLDVSDSTLYRLLKDIAAKDNIRWPK
jgi:DNA-binding CsgD family transcriptional regulator